MRCCFCSCMSVWANFRRDEYYIMGHHSFLFSYNNSATFSFTFFLIILFRLNIIKKKTIVNGRLQYVQKTNSYLFFLLPRNAQRWVISFIPGNVNYAPCSILPHVLDAGNWWLRWQDKWSIDQWSEAQRVNSNSYVRAWTSISTWCLSRVLGPAYWDPLYEYQAASNT